VRLDTARSSPSSSFMIRISLPTVLRGRQGFAQRFIGSVNVPGVSVTRGEAWTPRPRATFKESTSDAKTAEPEVSPSSELAVLEELETKVNWLASLMIHNANNVRPKRDGMKVGGHQASSASMVTVMTALYLRFLRPQDRVAVKPHAGPIFHALQYLMGRQKLENMQRYRGLGGVQPYPSRTKDMPEVDLSTGSVGLGAAATTFLALTESFLRKKGLHPKAWPGTTTVPRAPGRMIAIVGDAELDEGNVFECLRESWKLDVRNNWYIIDYNRQSLDKIMDEQSFRVIERMFRMNGWDVITLKYGKKLRHAFAQPGGTQLWQWINSCDNARYSALTFQGGQAWREAMLNDIPSEGREDFEALLASYNNVDLQTLMCNLGGHCLETVLEAFELASNTDKRTAFIAYTIKGYGLPMAGHRDNHSLQMSSEQMEKLQLDLGLTHANQWEPFASMKYEAAARRLVETAPINSVPTRLHELEQIPIPADIAPSVGAASSKKKVSSQMAFGAVLAELSKSKEVLADRILTAAPDVTSTTSLTPFVNKRGVFTTGEDEIDDFKRTKGVTSMYNWAKSGKGQHIELGIAEHNLATLLASAGLSAEIFGHRLFPIGTLYDPFVARCLDAIHYGAYMKSRFMLVGTPSGISLAPEGGAHQSIGTPLMGLSTPNMITFEPAFADEVKLMMRHGFERMQAPDEDGGSSIYLRLTTRQIEQLDRDLQVDAQLQADILKGAYWHVKPTSATKNVIVFSGVIAPEARSAQEMLGESTALLQITSYDLLSSDWMQDRENSHALSLLRNVPQNAQLVVVLDGHPLTLSWLGSVSGHRLRPLGVKEFGQSGDIPDLYKHHGIDTDSIVQACRAGC
jgi:pyruvate dehydrogenase E1 component